MKIKDLFIYFFSFFAFLSLVSEVEAYQTADSCTFTHSEQFDFPVVSNDSFAVLINKPGDLFVSMFDYYYGLGNDYEYFLYVNGVWQPVENQSSYVEEFRATKSGVSFSVDKTYALALFARAKVVGREDLYCSGQAKAFGIENAVTEPGWLGEEISLTNPDPYGVAPMYESPAVRSSSGKLIGGVVYTRNYLNGSGWDYFTANYNFAGVWSEACKWAMENAGSGGNTFIVPHVWGCGVPSQNVYYRLWTSSEVTAVVGSSVQVYSQSDETEVNPSVPEKEVFVESKDLRLTPYEEGGRRFVRVEVDEIRVNKGDSISEVYVKMADPLSGWVHVESNLISIEVMSGQCVGKQSCEIRTVYNVPDRIDHGGDYAAWVVIKSKNGSVCTDKPGVEAPICGSGVEAITIQPLVKSKPSLPVGIISPPVMPPGLITENVEPTPTIVERIVAAVEEKIIKPVRKTAAQIVGEYFESQQNQVVIEPEVIAVEPEEMVVEPVEEAVTEEIDDGSTVMIAMPWNLFK